METSASSVSPQQAADALLDVRRAQHRLSVLRGYEYGAPHFLLWGCVWVAGYASTALWPANAGVIWLVLDALGVLGGLLIVRATPSDGTRSAKSWRFLGSGATILAFILATYYVLAPSSGPQFAAFPALVMAVAYVLVGLWRGPRWIVVGLVVGGSTVIGYGLLHQYFMLWMAAVGGGSLLLTGLWMRTA